MEKITSEEEVSVDKSFSSTRIISVSDEIKNCKEFAQRVHARFMNQAEFINTHASGTLRKNQRIGMLWKDQYLEERVAFEFGYGFTILKQSRVTWGPARTESDCKPLTEAGWFIDRYLLRDLFPGDVIEAKYIIAEFDHEEKKEGVGIFVRETSASFIPKGYSVFAIIAEYDKKFKDFKTAVNPC